MKALRIVLTLILVLVFVPSVSAELNQEQFTDLATFLYTEGEKIFVPSATVYNITLEESMECNGDCRDSDPQTIGYLALFEDSATGDVYVVLTVETIHYITDAEGIRLKVVDQGFYYTFYDNETGKFPPIVQQIIRDTVIINAETSVVVDMNQKTNIFGTEQFKHEGYPSKEWDTWIDKFYNLMLEMKAKGELT